MGFAETIKSKKYITVETYKRDGQGVMTPVWFYVKDDCIYVITRSKTGKAKRLKNNPKVRVAQCTIKGKITGPWAHGIAEILNKSDTSDALALRDKKYGMVASFAKFFTRSKGEFFAFKIKLDE